MNARNDALTQRPCPAAVSRARRSGALLPVLGACLTLVFGPWMHVKAQSNQAPAGTDAPAASYDSLLDQAIAAFDASDFSRAEQLFERAYELRPNARVLRGKGVAALRLGRYSEAYAALSAALKHPSLPLTASQRDEVTELLSWMETNLASVRLRFSPSEPADYELLVDGKVLRQSTLWLAPGSHHLAIHAPGYGAVERTLTLQAEQHEVIELAVSPSESASAPAPKATPKAVPAPAVTPAAAAQSVASMPNEGMQQAPPSVPRVDRAGAGSKRSGGVLTRWWFWTLVGAVAAGGATAAMLLSNSASTSPPDTSGGSKLIVLE